MVLAFRAFLGTILILLSLAIPAKASRATLTFPSEPNFTLAQAHQTALSDETAWWHGQAFVAPCYWADRHDADCPVHMIAVIIDGLPPADITWTDVVTRAGPCSITGRVTHHGGLTIVKGGGGRPHNCFTGPLVVLQGTGT